MPSPTLKATFQLDEQGQPERIQNAGLNHYLIKVEIEDAPEDTYAVTYQLDESYYEPVRESRDPQQRFAEDLTSFGDYPIQAKIRTKGGVLTVSSPLSAALKAGHQPQLTAEIQTALSDIQLN
jgi:hypothetical protein